VCNSSFEFGKLKVVSRKKCGKGVSYEVIFPGTSKRVWVAGSSVKLKPFSDQIAAAERRLNEDGDDSDSDIKLEKKPKLLDLSKDSDDDDESQYQDWLKMTQELQDKILDMEIFPSSTPNS